MARHHLAVVVQFHAPLGGELPALALIDTRTLVVQLIAALMADAHRTAIGRKACLQTLATLAFVGHETACLHACGDRRARRATRQHGNTHQRSNKNEFHRFSSQNEHTGTIPGWRDTTMKIA